MLLFSLGANLPGPGGSPPLDTCKNAVRDIGAIPGIRLSAGSRWYQSAPVVPPGTAPQPDFVNAVVRAEFEPGCVQSPEQLLNRLMELEAAAGRVRTAPFGARTLDLDIIDIDGLVRDAPDPILPHPRAHERAFVLIPLAEVAPEWVHPRLNLPVETLIKRLAPQRLCVLEGP